MMFAGRPVKFEIWDLKFEGSLKRDFHRGTNDTRK
jgi:hypothetical protein